MISTLIEGKKKKKQPIHSEVLHCVKIGDNMSWTRRKQATRDGQLLLSKHFQAFPNYSHAWKRILCLDSGQENLSILNKYSSVPFNSIHIFPVFRPSVFSALKSTETK